MGTERRVAAPGARLNFEALENRDTPTAAYALSAAGLVAFNSDAPAVTTTKPITGVGANEALVGLDYRAQDGQFYALGVDADANTATLYTISVQTGEATAVGTSGGIAFSAPTGGPIDLPNPDEVQYDLDFDPEGGWLRVVLSNGLNFRVGPDGTPLDGDGGLAGAVSGINPDGVTNGLPGGSTGAGVTAYGPDPAAPGTTRQYTLDANSDGLFIQDSPRGGTQTHVADITLGGAPLDFTAATGFDISDNGAVAALTVDGVTSLYSLDLATGEATELGPVEPGAFGLALAPNSGVIAFTGATFTATEAGLAAEVTLTRDGITTGQVTVTVTPTGGTAVSGDDFQPGPYVVTFADGQTSATLTIPLTNDNLAEPDKSIDLTLSAPTDGAVLGEQVTATVTIADAGEPPPPPPPPPPLGPPGIILGTGRGSGTVSVLNPDGSLRWSLQPYGPTMRNGIRVATGDVTGDGVVDVITAPAVGSGQVIVYDGQTAAEVARLQAFDAGFLGGLTVAAGDVDGDGHADIIVGTALGSSHVKVFSGASGALINSFLAYDGFIGGVTVAAGDVDGDGRADVITGTATANSHVKVFSGATGAVMQSFLTFDGFSGGVTVASGDVDHDGRADVVVGAATGSSHVKVFSGASGAVTRSFLAFPGSALGVNVAARDLNDDELVDLLATTGTNVKGFDGGTAAEINHFLAFGADFSGGTFVS
jgi:hypothetical protein